MGYADQDLDLSVFFEEDDDVKIIMYPEARMNYIVKTNQMTKVFNGMINLKIQE